MAQQPKTSRKIKRAGSQSKAPEVTAENTEATKSGSSTKKVSKLDEAIARELAVDPAVLTSSNQPMSADSPEGKRLTSLEKIHCPAMCELGTPGVPEPDSERFIRGDNVIPLLPFLNESAKRDDMAKARKFVEDLDARLAAQKDEEDREKMAMATPKHLVKVMKNPTMTWPELYMRVFIQGPDWEEVAFADIFTRAKCSRARSIEEADFVVFTGGPDVDPLLYGETPHPMTHVDVNRDQDDISAYFKCYEAGIPMIGICRGAQFLHVMNGGKLYQHVDGHNGDHRIFDYRRRIWIDKVSSVHHQMCIKNPTGGMDVIAVSMKLAKTKWLNDKVSAEGATGGEVEVFFYRETLCLGIQGHPEYKNYPEFTQYSLELIHEYITLCPDTVCLRDDKGRLFLRMKPDLLAERKAQTLKKVLKAS